MTSEIKEKLDVTVNECSSTYNSGNYIEVPKSRELIFLNIHGVKIILLSSLWNDILPERSLDQAS